MTRLLRSSLALALALTAGLATRAHAQDEAARARAREHFTQGVARYEANDYQGALEQFQEAYRIAPHPSVRVNMANCYEQLGRPLEALHHFEGFLAESENPSREQRREVQAAIRRLQSQLGELRLTIAPDGARVTLDNAETRIAPVLEAIMLEAGTHTVEVSMDGFETDRREIEIEGGDTQRISIRLDRADPAVASAGPDEGTDEPAATDPVDEPTDEQNSVAEPALVEDPPMDDGGGWSFTLSAPVLIAGITTVVLGAAAITTGVLALDYESQSDDWAARYASSTGAQRAMAREEGLAATDTANTLSIITDVFLIGTIAAGAATIFFVIVDGMDSGGDAMAAQPGSVAFGGAVTDQGGAVSLSGHF